jgi:hypothetical protein
MRIRCALSKLMAVRSHQEVLAKAIRFGLLPFLLVAFFSPASDAQPHTYVSVLGDDGNPCSRTAPCRTFNIAVSWTDNRGDVVALDSGEFGHVDIYKSVSLIAAPGVHAGITTANDGIDIIAGPADTVVLRGLTVNNQPHSDRQPPGPAVQGILFLSGGTLHVESCIVNGFFEGSGLAFMSAGSLEVKDSIFRGNGTGIALLSPSGIAFAAIDHVRLESNLTGLFAAGWCRVSVHSCIASNNGDGFFAGGTGGSIELNLENCLSSNNRGKGIFSSSLAGTCVVRVSNSTVTNNGIGLAVAGDQSITVLLSRGNNTVEGNTVGINGPVASYTAK